MKEIIPFSKEESDILEKIFIELSSNDKANEIETIDNNKTALQQFASCISLYPSILKESHLGSAKRSVETLVQSLAREEQLDLRFHMPTKALLGNSFLIAKINFFFMLMYIALEIPELQDCHLDLKRIITNIVFTLMAEEVFLSIIDDRFIIKEIKINAGYLLANIWEYRLDLGVKEFSPILSNIWRARGVLNPTFGTMLGFSELFRISEYIEPAFFDFIQRDELSDEEVQALEEFIFGLTFEETQAVREMMGKNGKFVISRDDIDKLIGEDRVYPQYDISDPRELYRSFTDRKINAKYRIKSKMIGPLKTIEEYLMCYLLLHTEEKVTL